MAAPILHLRDIVYSLGGRPLLDGAEIGVAPGEKLCLVGRNGSGKSTLLRIAAGEILPDSGQCFVQPGVKIVYLPQEPDLSAFVTSYDYVAQDLEPEEDYLARSMLSELGLTGEESTATLSGGEARRCALARALLPGPIFFCSTSQQTILISQPLPGLSASWHPCAQHDCDQP